MKTLRFTEDDYTALIMLMGFAAGAMSERKDLPARDRMREVIDWTLIQSGNPATYTYWHPKEELRERKESELAAETPS